MGEKQWVDPSVYLFAGALCAARTERKRKTRNLLLQSLLDGLIRGYSPIVLSESTFNYHDILKMRQPNPIEPITQLGLWATSEGQAAIEEGKISWAFSTYDTKQVRELFFSIEELQTAFPSKTTKETSFPKQEVGKPNKIFRDVRAATLAAFPNGISNENGAIKSAKGVVSQQIGYEVKDALFRKVRNDLELKDWA